MKTNMSFSEEETTSILSDFPKFELSYETMTHKKVFDYNVILAIPDGIPCFAWFTSYKGDNVCFIMEININDNNNKYNNKYNNNTISKIGICLTSFNDKLSFGTIFYGTTFSVNGTSCFCIEDLYYYKGVNYSGKTFINRLETLKNILKTEISQQALTHNYMIFGLPLMGTDLIMLLKDIEQLPYKTMYLKYRWYETKKIMCAEYYTRANKPNYVARDEPKAIESMPKANKFEPKAIKFEPKAIKFEPKAIQSMPKAKEPMTKKKISQSQLSNAIFHITPDVRSDIYNLFVLNNGRIDFYDYAFIPDYETSVKMNKLFRNIKENNNLDALEESDDEDDFEDDRADKYVYLDRSYKMNCQFNYKFKKWMPISVINTKDAIVSYEQLSHNKF